ncbi:BTB/POZ domain-containing protein [Gossypium australe]|uniref:BTB/POZ domain-containing protein n=1 Tax=Gossypium australe TaxID=47621 RepID=A0A5B6WWV4_9ROSI|nr:BTB/POZ domain-containing protein [Gossypium australe]
MKETRSIIDNTLLAHELVKGYGRTTLSPRCALKIDISKAFNSLNWECLLAVLDAKGMSNFVARRWKQEFTCSMDVVSER